MTAPDIVKSLVDRFEQHRDAYRSGRYNETQLRREFLDPFFEALGWDIFNKQSYAEMYKDVIHEDSLEIEGENKAPDYAFRIGGTRKFFVEAKKPAVNIEMNIHPAFQLRRYAWSAKLPLGILTDFEEFAIYDCRIKPDKADKASTARVKLLSYKDYIERWDEITDVFSREAVLKGSFDEYAEGIKSRKGTTEVDDAFLAEIERWRDLLAKNMAVRNPVNVRELNYAVQMTIDRIVFLRICEDRGVERDEQLKEISEGRNVYSALVQLFQRADMRYNSGLFHFKNEKDQSSGADSLTPDLKIDDKILQDILRNLYYPESPYVFKEIPSDILGQVYERFLGKVIRLTAGHQAKVEEKPEVRKAGGVYYTPTYIVDYIVQNTVGKLLEDKTPKEVAKLKILDPACGSGTFALGAYQYLLEWHLKWYTENETQKWLTGKNPAIYQNKDGYLLTTAKKKAILLNNIFGVDIDAQAVEVTKLSLLLKVLEGESQETIGSQLSLLQERVLPDLGKNIQCGNSLIGPDYYEERQLTMLIDEEERYRVNVFDWKGAFPQVFIQGGFDVVIGNPPYLFITELGQAEKDHYFKKYRTTEYRFDVYGLFAELSTQFLLRDNGYLSFIIPHTLLSNDSFAKLRKLLLTTTFIELVTDIGPGVFENAKNETMVFVVRKDIVSESASTKVIVTDSKQFPVAIKEFNVKQHTWAENRNATWLVNVSKDEMQIISKLETTKYRLGDLCTINQGLRTGDNEKYLSDKNLGELWKPAAGGKHVGRYEPLKNELFVYYEPEVLDAPRRPELFVSPEKLVVQEIRNITLSRRIIAAYDSEQFYCLQSTNVINLRTNHPSNLILKYLLGILNSRCANYFFKQRFSGNNHIASNQLAQIPVPAVDKMRHDKIVALVERMLELHRRSPRTPQEQEMVKREIQSTDNQIDRLVYDLYGLTEDEIKIVEGKS